MGESLIAISDNPPNRNQRCRCSHPIEKSAASCALRSLQRFPCGCPSANGNRNWAEPPILPRPQPPPEKPPCCAGAKPLLHPTPPRGRIPDKPATPCVARRR